MNASYQRPGADPLALAGVALILVLEIALGPGRSTLVPSAARAASPSPLQQMSRALSAARSFEAITEQTSHGPAGTTSTNSALHTVELAVRTGTALHLYAMTTVKTAGKTLYSEIVYTGAQLCMRGSHAQPWICRAAPASAVSSLLSMDFPRAVAAAGADLRTVPVGQRLVEGHRCTGYTYSYSRAGSPALHGQGTIWLDPSTLRPVRQDAITTISGTAGGASFASNQTTVWSHWNDPTLQIPSVPVS